MHTFVRVLTCALLAGCGPELAPDPAQPHDSGPQPIADAGTVDGGASPTPDSGPRPDAGTRDPAPTPDAGAPDAGSRVDAGPPPSTDAPPVLGVTITNPYVTSSSRGALLSERLRALRSSTGRLPMARVVFDEGVDRVFSTYGDDASAYVEHVTAIGRDARVMGELLDSFYMRDYDVAQFRARACEYRATLGHLVDVWEVGNESNGEWLGSNVIEKITAAVEVFTADRATFEASLCPGFSLRTDERAFELALTLYYNGSYSGGRPSADNCWERADNAMLRWTATHFGPGGDAAHLVDRFAYVWVSYYEDDCEGIQPRWQEVFDELGRTFTTSALGFGECGTTDASRKARYVERYYRGMDSTDPALANMHVSHPRYVGGLFWWYFSSDLDVPAVTEGIEAALVLPFWSR